MTLIIFDCDGVLVDSEIIASKVNLKLIKNMGLELELEELSEKYSGLTGIKIFEEVAKTLNKPLQKDIVEQSEALLDKALDEELEAVEGVHDMLDNLQGPWCICSNSTTKRLRQTLKKTGLYARFSPYIYSAKEVREGRPKPAPDVFLHAAEAHKANPAETIVVEDSAHGVTGAVSAGMRVIGFTGGAHSYPGHSENLMEKGAETTVPRLADIPGVICAMKSWRGGLR